jgi:hypothetical protein
MKFNISTRDGVIAVKGTEISLIKYPGYRFFIHKSLEQPKFFVVSEFVTGRRCSHEWLTQQDAIDDAEKQFDRFGTEIVEKLIKEAHTESKVANGGKQ